MGETNTLTVFIGGGDSFLRSHCAASLLVCLSPESRLFVLSPDVSSSSSVPLDPRLVFLVGNIESSEDLAQYSDQLLSSSYVFHLGFDKTDDSVHYTVFETVPSLGLIDALKSSSALKQCIVVRQSWQKEPLGSHTLPITWIELGQVYGRDMSARSLLSQAVSLVQEKRWIVHGNFSHPISLIHINDLSAAFAACLNNTEVIGRTYTAITETLSLGSIFAVLYESVRGRKPRQWRLPTPARLLRRRYLSLPPVAVQSVENHRSINELLGSSAHPVHRLADFAFDVIATHIDVMGYWLITGANSGIGYELASRLHGAGKKLILVDKEIGKLGNFGNDIIIMADLADSADIKKVCATASQYKIFGLVNNAGLGYRGDFRETDNDKIQLMAAVNIFAPLHLTKMLLPAIIKNNGVIINVASSAAYNPLPGMGVYAATKSFMLNWSLALWRELKGRCLVITVCPSGTNTRFQQQAGVNGNPANLLTPEYVVARILQAIKTKKSFLFLGAKSHLMVYLTRLLPGPWSAVLWSYLFKKLR